MQFFIEPPEASIQFALRVLVAAALGAAIGLERQWRQRLAGLRTNCLVALGASAYVALSALVPGVDSPSRIAAQIVSGIGFLGAGVIFREGASVRGLNTAATLWCSAAVGALAGSGAWSVAFGTAAIVVGANVLLRPLDLLINRQPLDRQSEVEVCYVLNVRCSDQSEPDVRALIVQSAAAQALTLRSMRSENSQDLGRADLETELVTSGRKDGVIEQLTTQLSMDPRVSLVAWRIRGRFRR